MATASQGPWGPTNAAPSSALTRENASGTRINATGRSENEIERRRKRRRRHENPRRQREKPRPEEDRDGGKKRERRTENPHPRQGLARNLLVLSVRTEHPWKLAVRFRLGLFVTHSRCVSLLLLPLLFHLILFFLLLPPLPVSSFSLFRHLSSSVVLFIPAIVAARFLSTSSPPRSPPRTRTCLGREREIAVIRRERRGKVGKHANRTLPRPGHPTTQRS